MIIERQSVVHMIVITQRANKTGRLLINIQLVCVILQASALVPTPGKVLSGLKLCSENCGTIHTFVGNCDSMQNSEEAMSILFANALMC